MPALLARWCPARRRREPGLRLCAEHGKASVDTVRPVEMVHVAPGRERERAEAETEGTEYRCGARRRTGP